MKFDQKYIIILSVLVLLLAIAAISQNFMSPTILDPKEICEKNDLTWLEEHKECEFMDNATCANLEGTFVECGSACSHDPSAEYCILMCVPYCYFD